MTGLWPSGRGRCFRRNRPAAIRGIATVAACAVGLAAPVPAARAAGTPSEADGSAWVTNGAVEAIAHVSGTTYIGGDFTLVGPRTGYGAAISTASGTYDASLPKVAGGQIYGVAPDGSGGWYIGGDFAYVGDQPRNRLAHILPDKTLDAAWNPGADNTVRAIAVSGSTVYVGGQFGSVGGAGRSQIAALSAATGAATNWDPNADGAVYALAVSGTTVYAGGSFANIGGQARGDLAALDANTNVNMATAWNPNGDGTVRAIAVSGSTVYVGGGFANIGGQARNRLAALDANVNANMATTWNPGANQDVYALAVSGGTVYAGGAFGTIGTNNASRGNIAAIDATGAATPWDPSANGAVGALAVSGSTVYAGGSFTTIGGQARNYLAALDANANTNMATSWNPSANNVVNAFALSGSTVYAGGNFTSVNAVTRNRLAALDSTGAATSWNPNANNHVAALTVHGSTIYAGGTFTTVGGQPHNYIAAIDAATGNPASWDPNIEGEVFAFAKLGSTIYVAGTIGSFFGQPRCRLAAFDADTGSVTGWDPCADSNVRALAAYGSTVYAGGHFTVLGGQARERIGAVDATTGLATSWYPPGGVTGGGSPEELVATASTVYAAGGFTTIGGVGRNGLAALDSSSAAVTDWDPNPNSTPLVLAVSGSTVYVGGSFGTIGGQARNRLAAIDASTGTAGDWNPNTDNEVRALWATDSNVYAGGLFTAAGNRSTQGYASFTAAPQNIVAPSVLGGPDVGSVLTCLPGTWLNEPTTFDYKWLRDGIEIGGATASTYTLIGLDAGRSIVCVVTAGNIGGSPSTSTPAVTVAPEAASPGETTSPGPGNSTAPTGACDTLLGGPLVAATHWQGLGRGVRVRLRSLPGGYIARHGSQTSFVVEARRTHARRLAGLRRVDFSLAGQDVGSDREAPFAVSLDPDGVAPGYHELRATAHAAGGGTRTMRLGFYATDCDREPPALSVSLSSKLAGAHPDVDLWARTSGPALRAVKFTLPRSLRLSTPGLSGRIGAVEVVGARSISTKSLNVAQGGSSAGDLTRSRKLRVELDRQTDGGAAISASGLTDYEAIGVRVKLYGKATRMVRNPASCERRLEFTATLEYADMATSSLARSLQMCKPGTR